MGFHSFLQKSPRIGEKQGQIAGISRPKFVVSPHGCPVALVLFVDSCQSSGNQAWLARKSPYKWRVLAGKIIYKWYPTLFEYLNVCDLL